MTQTLDGARTLHEPLPERLPADPRLRADVLAAHEAAMERGDLGYRDPLTGLFVMTAQYLVDRGYCCGNGCRHCPYRQDDRVGA